MTNGQTGGWAAETRRRARLLQAQLSRIEGSAERSNVPTELLERMLEPYRNLLETVHVDDLQLAKLLDDGDLIVRASGQAADAPSPRLTLFSKLLGEFRDGVGQVARMLAHVDEPRLPPELELNLAGIARGSLFLAFRVQTASPGDAQGTLLSNAASTAIQHILTTAPAIVSENRDQLLALDDPAERDTLVSVLHKLSPSGIIGVRRLQLWGRGATTPVELTVETRRTARSLLSKPLERLPDTVELVGTVRELDIDQQRFELRHVEGRRDVRCAFDFDVEQARWLLGRRVRAKGRPEYDRRYRDQLRLLWVDEFEPLDTRST